MMKVDFWLAGFLAACQLPGGLAGDLPASWRLAGFQAACWLPGSLPASWQLAGLPLSRRLAGGPAACQLLATCSKNCDALAARAGAAGRVHDYADAGHFAQTDAPVVFEQGPLSFVYDALRGQDGAMDSATALRRCTEESVAALASFFSAESG